MTQCDENPTAETTAARTIISRSGTRHILPSVLDAGADPSIRVNTLCGF
jgi:hypothetical protein